MTSTPASSMEDFSFDLMRRTSDLGLSCLSCLPMLLLLYLPLHFQRLVTTSRNSSCYVNQTALVSPRLFSSVIYSFCLANSTAFCATGGCASDLLFAQPLFAGLPVVLLVRGTAQEFLHFYYATFDIRRDVSLDCGSNLPFWKINSHFLCTLASSALLYQIRSIPSDEIPGFCFWLVNSSNFFLTRECHATHSLSFYYRGSVNLGAAFMD